MKTILVLVMMMTLSSFGVTVSSNLLHSIAMVESNGRNGLVGDLKRKDHAYGIYQIRRQYLSDVQRVYKKEVIAKYGRLLTLEDMRTSPEKSKFVVTKYLSYYGAIYEKKTGLPATNYVLWRLHNGGPSSWNKDKYPALYASTSKYVAKATKYYKA